MIIISLFGQLGLKASSSQWCGTLKRTIADACLRGLLGIVSTPQQHRKLGHFLPMTRVWPEGVHSGPEGVDLGPEGVERFRTTRGVGYIMML